MVFLMTFRKCLQGVIKDFLIIHSKFYGSPQMRGRYTLYTVCEFLLCLCLDIINDIVMLFHVMKAHEVYDRYKLHGFEPCDPHE